jgi:hypothetical protein
VRLRGMHGTELVFQVLREDDSDKVVVFEHGDCILARCRKFMRYVVLVSLISLRHRVFSLDLCSILLTD